MFLFRLLIWLGCAFLIHPAVLGGDPSRFHEIAHLGDGSGIRTVFLVSNQNAEEAQVRLEFFNDEGAALSLTIDGTTASTFEFTIPAGGSKKMATSGTSSPLATGWAQLRASRAVGAQALFEISRTASPKKAKQGLKAESEPRGNHAPAPSEEA